MSPHYSQSTNQLFIIGLVLLLSITTFGYTPTDLQTTKVANNNNQAIDILIDASTENCLELNTTCGDDINVTKGNYLLHKQIEEEGFTWKKLINSVKNFFGYKLVTGAQSFQKSADPGPYQSGDFVEFTLLLSCSSLTTGCGDATITDVIPSDLIYVNTVVPQGSTSSYNNSTNTLTIDSPNLADGDTRSFTVILQVPTNVTAGITISNTACSSITEAISTDNETVCSEASIMIDPTPPSPMYTFTKSILGEIQVDVPVDYRIRLCADQLSGNTNLNDVTITDQLPAGVTVVDAGGGTYDAASNTITWDEGDVLLDDLYSGPFSSPNSSACITKNIEVIYPSSAGFVEGDNVTNSASFVGTPDPGDGSTITDSDATTNPIIGAEPGSNLSKSASPSSVVAGNDFEFRIGLSNNGNVDLENYVITDTWTHGLPLLEAEMPSPSGTYMFIFETTNDGGTTWVVQSTTATENQNFTFTAADGINGIRLTPYNDGDPALPNQFAEGNSASFGSSSLILTHNVPAGTPDGTTYFNEVSDAADNPDFVPDTDDATTTVIPLVIPDMTQEPYILKDITPSSVSPGGTFQVRLRGFNRSGADICVPDPVIFDLLPPEMIYNGNITWSAGNNNSSAPAPNVEVIENYNNTGQTLVRFTWSDTPPAGATAIDGSPAVPNGYCFEAAAGGFFSQPSQLNFDAQLKAGLLAGDYFNTAYIDGAATDDECDCSIVDSNDLDGDGDTTEMFCDCDSDNVRLLPAASLVGEKWVKGDPALPNIDDPNSNPAIDDADCPVYDDGFTRFPCIAQGAPGSIFEYKILVINAGTEPLTDYIHYDILPYINDTGVSEILSSAMRESEWQPTLVSLTPGNTFTTALMPVIEWSESTDPCRPEVSNSSDESGWQTSCDDDWTTTMPPTENIRSFRLKAAFPSPDFWQPGDSIVLCVKMMIPADADFETVSWNSFAHRVTNATDGTRLLTAEPRKTGIQIPTQASLPCITNVTNPSQSNCFNAGTPGDSSDDYFTVTLDAIEASGVGTMYEVVLGANADGTGGTVLGTSAYGTPITVGDGVNGAVGTFAADGATTYDIYIRNADDNTCFDVYTTVLTNSCSAGSFDLALTKVINTTATPGPFSPGNTVQFTITVLNQGTIDAYDIDVTDYNPTGLGTATLIAGQTGVSENSANNFTVDFLSAGMSFTFEVEAVIDASFMGTSLINDAEITGGSDTDGGSNAMDIDSTPGNNATPEDTTNDNDIADTMGGDDQDPAQVDVVQTAICNPSAAIFAIQPSCTNGTAGSDGYLQISSVTNADRFHWSTGSTFDDNAGANTFANATNLSSVTYPHQFNTGLSNADVGDFTIRVYNGADDCFTDVVVTLTPQECYSLGNQVFADTDNSGDLNGTEAGIDGVELQLLNGDGSVYDSDPNIPGDQPLTVTTANGGYYRFDGLPAGNYIVEVVASNFTGVLDGFNSSTGANQEANPDSDGDTNDNGLDTSVNGAIRSGIVTLGMSEPTGEAEPATYAAGSTTGTAAADNFNNLTVDFGFFNCNINSAELMTVVCNNNGTISDNSDDFISFTLNPMGNNIGSSYNATVSSGTISPTTANYGSTTDFQLQNGSVGTGNVVVTITDASNSDCSLDVTITDPGNCTQAADFADFALPGFPPCPDAACHMVNTDLMLGTMISADNGMMSDSTGTADNDDGITFPNNLRPGVDIRIQIQVTNNTGMDAFVSGWADWNDDGDFDDIGELIITTTYPNSGVFSMSESISIPTSTSLTSEIAMRFRVSTDQTAVNSPCGPSVCAPDGEVEDYLIQLECPPIICLPPKIQINRD